MDLLKERELNYEMLRDLVQERRAITEMMLDIKQTIKRLDGEIERYQETLSAKEYINLRNSMKRELEVSMREQIRAELEAEFAQQQPTYEEPQESSIVPLQEMEHAKEREAKKTSRKDISLQTVCKIALTYCKEIGGMVATDDLKAHLEQNRNHTWTKQSFTQLVWKMKNELGGQLYTPTRGYIQYRETPNENE